jgi:transcriptional regulator with PAS, ATPase and Fis domain
MEEKTKTHTMTAIGGLDGGAQTDVWNLSIVHHSDPTFLGKRFAVQTEASVDLGREETCLGPGALSESRISRKHARVWVTGGGTIKVEDKGSRNGTFLNGERIEQADMAAGDVLRLGNVLILIHRCPAVYSIPAHPTLIGVSYAMSEVVADIDRVARHTTTVLIYGETGTGKELVSRAIHDESERKGAFKVINCGGMTDTLLQSELFGHVRGAFSGADRDREGLIEAANDGTLFLDEIGDASPSLQVSLLRFLQEGEVRRIGGNQTRKVNTRIIAASHRRLDQMVADGSFREDLFARLSRWEIHLPPLRDRLEDVPHLVQLFLKQQEHPEPELHYSLSLLLNRYHWPRNVRELEMAVERAVIESDGQSPIAVTPAVARLLERREVSGDEVGAEVPSSARADTKKMRNKAGLEGLLRKHGGNVRLVSQELGVARNTLYRWFSSFDLDPESFRE